MIPVRNILFHNFSKSKHGELSSASFLCRAFSQISKSRRMIDFQMAKSRPITGQVTMPSSGFIRHFHRIPGASTRDLADLEDRLWLAVGTKVKDPEVNLDLKTLEWMSRKIAVSDIGTIQILLKLPSLLHPQLGSLKNLVKRAAEDEVNLWAKELGLQVEVKVNVEAIPSKPVSWMTILSNNHEEVEKRLGPGLANVAHILAVYSCKGGVGKSTVAVNLAYELARIGGRVGLLDLDVYGPSLPILLKPDDPSVRRSPLGKGMVFPIEHKGVKFLSLGFVSPSSGVPGSGQEGGAAVMRGPMAGKVVNQLLKGTDWGYLDVLVLDLPPGTGDVQLTLCQELELSGAVGVTTPSKLAIADARKGIDMFSSLGVSTFAMVENMAYFECEGGKRHFPFGRGFKELLGHKWPIPDMHAKNVVQLPISSFANQANDSGIPLCLARPESAEKELCAFSELARAVTSELFRLPYRYGRSEGFVYFEETNGKFDLSAMQVSLEQESTILVRFFSETEALQKHIPPEALRNRDPKTGKMFEPTSENIESEELDGMVVLHKTRSQRRQSHPVPIRIEKKAKIGYEISWDDGSKFIYTKNAIALAAGGIINLI